MTLDDVRKRVDEIRRVSWDDEVAHSREGDLHIDVLRAIADGAAEDPKAMAKLALETCDIDFARWCA